MKKFLLSITILLLLSSCTLAQVDTPLSEVQATEIEELNEKEEKRSEEIANLLGFTLPEYTDNPSHIVTFKDPSPEKSGVEINLDGKGFSTISSPYTFPALSIGRHEVKFRFTDQTGTVKLLEYILIIIPRAPILDTPKISETSISISGSALANSDVIYFLTANAYHSTDVVQTGSDGTWSIEITPAEGFSDGIYTLTAYTRRYGFASVLSTPVTFTVGDSTVTPVETQKGSDIFFSFDSITTQNAADILKQNVDLIWLLLAVFLLGIILSNIIRSIVNSSKSEKSAKEFESVLQKQSEESSQESKTLRELFGGEKKIEEKKEKKEVVKKEEEEEEKEDMPSKTVINKDVFLKKYKMVDPDDTSGKEVKSKKKVKISLTSKEE